MVIGVIEYYLFYRFYLFYLNDTCSSALASNFFLGGGGGGGQKKKRDKFGMFLDAKLLGYRKKYFIYNIRGLR